MNFAPPAAPSFAALRCSASLRNFACSGGGPRRGYAKTPRPRPLFSRLLLPSARPSLRSPLRSFVRSLLRFAPHSLTTVLAPGLCVGRSLGASAGLGSGGFVFLFFFLFFLRAWRVRPAAWFVWWCAVFLSSLPGGSFVLFGGSRSLGAAWSGLVSACVSAALVRCVGVSVGCAAGADAVALSSALGAPSFSPGLVRLAAVGASSGAGFWSGSAPFGLLARAAAAGVPVAWSAGGGSSVPFRARLLRRSLAALSGCAGAVFFLASPGSSGSLRVAGAAAASGVPVVVFACGFSAPPCPPCPPRLGRGRLASGSWSPAGSFCGAARWVWVPA